MYTFNTSDTILYSMYMNRTKKNSGLEELHEAFCGHFVGRDKSTHIVDPSVGAEYMKFCGRFTSQVLVV